MDRILQTWRVLDLRRRVILAGAALLTIIAVLSLAQVATRPGMALLYSGLDPATAGEVLGALEQMNVTSEVRGDAIYVEEDARDRVRLSLARDGLPRQGQAGYELLDQISGFSATTDMFNAAYWRAKEGELARTILASPGVRAARVHIAAPSRRPFSNTEAKVTASITVTMAGGTLTPAQATAFRYLVALAVAELSPEQVAVLDSRRGMILAPGSENPLADAATEAQSRETKLKAEIEQLLDARVGRDKARVSVTVETDREAETVSEKIIQPESRVTINSDSEEITDSSSGTAGNVTVASNLPAGDAKNGADRKSARNETRERVNYDYSEIRRERTRQPGAIRRISVAVLVDGISAPDSEGKLQWQPRGADELSALRQLVIAAIGYDEARGDIVTVESMAFQPDATPGELVEISPIRRFIERNAMTLIQIIVLAAVAVVLALSVVRPLLSRSAASGPAAAFMPAALEAGPATTDDRMLAGSPAPAALPQGVDGPAKDGETLRTAVAQNPEQTVETLREWLSPGEEEAA